jgi:hypothetical protein
MISRRLRVLLVDQAPHELARALAAVLAPHHVDVAHEALEAARLILVATSDPSSESRLLLERAAAPCVDVRELERRLVELSRRCTAPHLHLVRAS